MHRSSLRLRPCPAAFVVQTPRGFYSFTALAFTRIPFFNGFFDLLAQLRAIDKCLLPPAQQSTERQINGKSGRHAPAKGSKHQWTHKGHDLLLCRVHATLRRALLLHEHGYNDDDGRNMQWVGHGEIVYPEPVRLSQLNS